MQDEPSQKQNDIRTAARDYARKVEPIDKETGWRHADIELAFIAGAKWDSRSCT